MAKNQVCMGLKMFFRRLWRLITQPIFIALTLFGNIAIVTAATLLYNLEAGSNPRIHSMLDTIWWAVSTVTTVGYGDVIPVTPSGRVVGIFLMIIGTALFWSYTALFAEALISKDISDLEGDLRDVEKLLVKIEREKSHDKVEIKTALLSIREQLARLS